MEESVGRNRTIEQWAVGHATPSMNSRDTSKSGAFGQADSGYRYEYRHEYDADASHLDYHITEAIANAAGVDATELRIPLWDAIDVEALSSLFHGDQSGTVKFWYEQFRVEVHIADEGTGHITVSSGTVASD